VPDFLEAKAGLDTVGKYKQQLRDYLQPFFGKMQLVKITRSDVIRYYNQAKERASIATANSEINCLKSLFTEAILAGHIEYSPAHQIKLTPPNNTRHRMLSAEEAEALFIAAVADREQLKVALGVTNEIRRYKTSDGRRMGRKMPSLVDTPAYMRPLFVLLYFTGFRIGEAVALSWEDVDFANARIIIRDAKGGEGRIEAMHDMVADEFLIWREICGSKKWVFPGRGTGSHLTYTGLHKSWQRLVALANLILEKRGSDKRIVDLHRHDMRHNFISHLANQGVNTLVLKGLAGHKSVAMTDRYTMSGHQNKLAALRLMPAPSGTLIVQNISKSVQIVQAEESSTET
jgi:integrase